MRARPLLLASLSITLHVLATPSQARADEKDTCVAAHSSGQVLRNQGKVRAARASFITCASEKCPPLVRRDCTQWHQELAAAQPSIVLEVRDARGNEANDAKARLDDEPYTDHLTGIAHEVDPGEHVFRVELASGESIEQKFVAFMGAKNQRVIVRAAAAAPVVAPPAPAEQPPPVASSRRPPTLAYVFGGVGIASLGVFAGFSIAGLAKEKDLRNTCAPFCAQSDIDTAKRDYLIGDIGLGVAIVATAATIYVLLSAKEPRPVATVTSRSP